jgi:hypothetical protein
MPKEYIHSMDHGRSVPIVTDGSFEPEAIVLRKMDDDAIKLGWTKEGCHVGLAIVDTEKDIDGFDAQHINLDRAGINRLIRFLRRARDDAFGKDE